MVDKSTVVQMCIHAPEFKMPVKLDDKFEYIELSNFDKEEDLKILLTSIDQKLSDWEDRPDLDNLKKRFEAGCSVFLQYYKNKICGWFWTCDFLTYDWVNKIKDLPTPDSNYGGGAYVIKSVAPSNTGIQLYTYSLGKILSRNDYVYGYIDKWNKAPIRLNLNCGAHYINNLL